MNIRLAPRSYVRQVACPYCYAPIGQKCLTSRGEQREANHAERVLAWMAAGDEEDLF